MNPDQRIEAAVLGAFAEIKSVVRVFLRDWEDKDTLPSEAAEELLLIILGHKRIKEAFYPELHGPSPSAWIAPMELTSAMYDAGDHSSGCINDQGHCYNFDEAWAAMRDAHLAEPTVTERRHDDMDC